MSRIEKEDNRILTQSQNAVSVSDQAASGLSKMLHSGLGVMPSFMKDIFLKKQGIVGARYQGGSDELMEDLDPGTRVTFLREPDNQHDPKAIMALDAEGRKIGYIPRSENGLMSALMDAGKRFYGIVAIDPATSRPDSRTPFQIIVDLYMQEYVKPGELDYIPRQGADGSYAVLSFRVSRDKSHRLRRVFALRIINGEERGSFHKVFTAVPAESVPAETISAESGNSSAKARSEEQYCREVEEFAEFIGSLPIVVHDIEGLPEKGLEEAWGLVLGKAFSNRIIDTKVMAKNHLFRQQDLSLDALADELDLEEGNLPQDEKRCRQTWELYRRMDKSDLEGKDQKEQAVWEEYQQDVDEYLRAHCLVKFVEYGEAENYPAATYALEKAVELGYREDYSAISMFYLNDEIGPKDISRGYYWAKRFYDDYRNGRLHLANDRPLIRICNNLAAIELWKLQDKYAGRVPDPSELEGIMEYWKTEVEAAESIEAPEENASEAHMLLGAAACLYNGEVHTDGHPDLQIPKDFGYAKRAAAEAARRGSKDAAEFLKEIEEERQDV